MQKEYQNNILGLFKELTYFFMWQKLNLELSFEI